MKKNEQTHLKVLEEYSNLLKKALDAITKISHDQKIHDSNGHEKAKAFNFFEVIANRQYWAAYGILTKGELNQLSMLEHIITDDSPGVATYEHLPRLSTD